MTHPTLRSTSLSFALAIGAAVMIAAPVMAEREIVHLKPSELHPRTAADVRHVVGRIDRAALHVCGASEFSLREVKIDARHSTCWKEAVAGALAQIDDIRVAEAAARIQRRS